jgi:acetyltransferase-like isoleucine patch superfamily enzyme
MMMATEDIEKKRSAEQWPGLHTKLFNPKKSPMQQYKEMVIGEKGWGSLIYYELIILFFSLIPGALGIVLRKSFFKPLFKDVGKNVVFGRNMVLRQPHKITLGDNVIIDDDCTLDAKGDSNDGIKIGDMVTIGRFSSIVCKDADIDIGSHVNIGSNVKVIAANKGKIAIGNSIDIGSSCHFSGGSYDYSNAEQLPSSQRIETKGINVEDLAWIGAGVIILDGVTIGSKSIIGAGAVVTDEIPPNSIAAGVPAKVKKTR